MAQVLSFSLGTSLFNPITGSSGTVAMWIYPTANGGSNGGILLANGDLYFSLSQLSTNQISIYYYNNGIYAFASNAQVTLNAWHQIVYSWTPTGSNLYIDGSLDTSSALTWSGAQWNGNQLTTMGDGIGNVANSYYQGSIDEVAFWSRPLSTPEALELYRRGANRIKYQVRTCTASDCSDNANTDWIGPDNTDQSYFSELNNTSIQSDGGDPNESNSVLAGLPNIVFQNFVNFFIPSHRYFQYRAILESDDASTNCNYGAGPTWCSPELKSTTETSTH